MNDKYDLTGAIIDFETGQLNNKETLVLFSHLIKTGKAWSLQGSYGRAARSLIDGGYISEKGEILDREGEM